MKDSHKCHAIDCHKTVKPELLMCYYHWKMVPKRLQAEVWKHYRPGQCDDKTVTSEYLTAAANAINHVAQKEGVPGRHPVLNTSITTFATATIQPES